MKCFTMTPRSEINIWTSNLWGLKCTLDFLKKHYSDMVMSLYV